MREDRKSGGIVSSKQWRAGFSALVCLLVTVGVLGAGPGMCQEVSVQVTQPVIQDIHREIALPGSLKPLEEADLYAKVPGYLSKIHFDIGDRVKKGDVIAELSIPEMEPQIVQAEAKVEEAKARVMEARSLAEAAIAQAAAARERENAMSAEIHEKEVLADLKRIVFERMDALRKDRAVTELEHEEAKGEFESAKAQHESTKARLASTRANTKSAEENVKVAQSKIAVAEAAVHSTHAQLLRLRAVASYATITAPYDGLISARYVHPGQLINEGMSGERTPIVRIVRDERLRLHFDLPEKDIPYVEVGSPLTFVPDAHRGAECEARVTRLAGELGQRSRTMLAEAMIENENPSLHPGMFVRLNLRLDIRKDAVTLPATALVMNEGQPCVWVVDGEVAKRTAVQIGYDDGDVVEVTQGIADGVKVVISGQVSLREGSKVRIAGSSGT